MRNKIWIALVVVLIVALVGIYMASAGSKKLGQSLTEVVKRIDADIQRLNLKTTPFVYVGEAVGYVIEFENGAKFYNTGDSGLTADMKVIGDYYKPDVAMMAIGNVYSMDSKAAAYAASLVNPAKYVVPTHYKTLPAVTQTPDEFFAELEKYGLRAKPLGFEIGVEQNLMGIKARWFSLNQWLFETPEGTKILIDPWIKDNPFAPEWHKDLSKLGRIDLILITHGHYDHLMVSDLRELIKLYKPIIIVQFEAGIWLKGVLGYGDILAMNKGGNISKTELLKMGLPTEKIEKMANIRIHMVPATHSSSATPEGMPLLY